MGLFYYTYICLQFTMNIISLSLSYTHLFLLPPIVTPTLSTCPPSKVFIFCPVFSLQTSLKAFLLSFIVWPRPCPILLSLLPPFSEHRDYKGDKSKSASCGNSLVQAWYTLPTDESLVQGHTGPECLESLSHVLQSTPESWKHNRGLFTLLALTALHEVQHSNRALLAGSFSGYVIALLLFLLFC